VKTKGRQLEAVRLGKDWRHR